MEQYYDALEVSSNASFSEVKAAYRDMVKVWHPDRFESGSRLEKKATEKLKEINEAFSKIRKARSPQHAWSINANRSQQRQARSRTRRHNKYRTTQCSAGDAKDYERWSWNNRRAKDCQARNNSTYGSSYISKGDRTIKWLLILIAFVGFLTALLFGVNLYGVNL